MEKECQPHITGPQPLIFFGVPAISPNSFTCFVENLLIVANLPIRLRLGRIFLPEGYEFEGSSRVSDHDLNQMNWLFRYDRMHTNYLNGCLHKTASSMRKGRKYGRILLPARRLSQPLLQLGDTSDQPFNLLLLFPDDPVTLGELRVQLGNLRCLLRELSVSPIGLHAIEYTLRLIGVLEVLVAEPKTRTTWSDMEHMRSPPERLPRGFRQALELPVFVALSQGVLFEEMAE